MKGHLRYVGIFFVMFVAIGCKTKESLFAFDQLRWTAAWHPNKSVVATGGNHGSLDLYNSTDSSPIQTLERSNTITKIKWHPDGILIAITRQWNDLSSSHDHRAEIINIETGESVLLPTSSSRGLGWNHKADLLAVGDGEGDLYFYNLDGKLVKKVMTEQKSITGLSWHPTKDILVTVGSHIEVVDVHTESRKKIIPRELEILMLCVEWHPSGDFFVTGDYGDNILNHPALLIFWNSDGQRMNTIQKSKAEYRNLSWSKDGAYLITASDKIRKWSKDGKLLEERHLGGLLWGIDWGLDDTQIVTTREDGKIYILDSNLNVIKSY